MIFVQANWIWRKNKILKVTKHSKVPLDVLCEEIFKRNKHSHLSRSKIGWLNGGIFLWLIKGDFLHEPFERFALQFLSEGLLPGDIARVEISVMRTSHVQVLFVLVHPHFGHSFVVLKDERNTCFQIWEKLHFRLINFIEILALLWNFLLSYNLLLKKI